jgi:hypothetical protein
MKEKLDDHDLKKLNDKELKTLHAQFVADRDALNAQVSAAAEELESRHCDDQAKALIAKMTPAQKALRP